MIESQNLHDRISKKTPQKTSEIVRVFWSTFIILSLFSVFAFTDSFAGVNVNVGINVPLPPPFVIHAPPPVVVLPGAEYVYFAPGLEVDIFFHRGYWYRPFNQRWYRSSSYNGPWAFIHPNHVPRALYSIPPDYRHLPPGREHIPYGQFKKNWGSWERDRHWDKHDGPPGRGRPEPWNRDNDRDWGRGGPGGHGRGHGPR
jgi:hypothetical protein